MQIDWIDVYNELPLDLPKGYYLREGGVWFPDHKSNKKPILPLCSEILLLYTPNAKSKAC